MKIRIRGYNAAIEGKELVVKKTTRSIAAIQQQTGWDLSEMTKAEQAVYGPAMAAFCALTIAGFEPSFDDLIDRDVDDFEIIQEKGDVRPQAGGAQDPQSSLDASSPDGDEGSATSPAA